MKYNVKISPEARDEIKEALDYYGKINTKLSVKLFNIIFDNFNFIRNNPFSFAIKYKNVRTFTIEKFPFIICYFIDDQRNTVNIISVFNTYKNPEKWQERIND